jgi:hypothetical protein
MTGNQNQIDREFSTEELNDLDAAITRLEQLTTDLPSLNAEDKAGLVKPPEGAGDWMHSMTTRAEQNLNKLPRELDPTTIRRDLKLEETLATRELRVARVLDRIACARFLARSDAFAALLGVRRRLKDAGVAGVDDDLSDGLRRFFSRRGEVKPSVSTGSAK